MFRKSKIMKNNKGLFIQNFEIFIGTFKVNNDTAHSWYKL